MILSLAHGNVQFEEFLKDIEEVKTEGRIILASGQTDVRAKEISVKHDGTNQPHYHGIYSFYLLQGLNGDAANEDGIITLKNLYQYLEKKMLETGLQKPTFSMTGSGLEQLRIAIASDKYTANIESLVKEVQKLLDTEDVGSMRIAASNLPAI